MSASQTYTKLLRDLVAFPTVSSDSNLALIDYIDNYLAKFDVEVQTFVNETGDKANLFATIGPRIDGGTILSGHTDVVPVSDQSWSHDPFDLVERDQRLYGRGSCDMKGFIAVALSLVPSFASAPLKRPIHLAFTYDEEVGCLGGQALVSELQRQALKPAVAIVGEPTDMRVIEGHKGCCEYAVTFSGLDGHGSIPDTGVNAVEYAARYVAKLLDLKDELISRKRSDSKFDPPWSTLQVGRISGGIARNVIAGRCELDWELRPVTQQDGDHVKSSISQYVDETLLPQMQAVHPEASIHTEVVADIVGLEPIPHSVAIKLVSELTGSNSTDLVSFGTEAGLFQELGISTVVCGPGSIAQAHKPDEYVELEQLHRAQAMLLGLQQRLCV